MSCPHIKSCELFPLISGSDALKIWRSYYCDCNYEACKRYQSTMDGEKIPLSLLPNGKNLEITDELLVNQELLKKSG